MSYPYGVIFIIADIGNQKNIPGSIENRFDNF
jgi:hypothetical protein